MLIHASLPGQNLKKKTQNKSDYLTIKNNLNLSDSFLFINCTSEKFTFTPGK